MYDSSMTWTEHWCGTKNGTQEIFVAMTSCCYFANDNISLSRETLIRVGRWWRHTRFSNKRVHNTTRCTVSDCLSVHRLYRCSDTIEERRGSDGYRGFLGLSSCSCFWESSVDAVLKLKRKLIGDLRASTFPVLRNRIYHHVCCSHVLISAEHSLRLLGHDCSWELQGLKPSAFTRYQPHHASIMHGGKTGGVE